MVLSRPRRTPGTFFDYYTDLLSKDACKLFTKYTQRRVREEAEAILRTDGEGDIHRQTEHVPFDGRRTRCTMGRRGFLARDHGYPLSTAMAGLLLRRED